MSDLNKCPHCDYPTDHELELGEIYVCPNCKQVTNLSICDAEKPKEKVVN